MGLINNFESLGVRARAFAGAASGILGKAATPPPARREGDMAAAGSAPVVPGTSIHEGFGVDVRGASVSVPQASPVGGPSGVVGQAATPRSAPLSALSEIDGYQPDTATVLTTQPNIQLSPQQQRVAVPLEVKGRVIVIWTGLAEDRRTYSDLLTLLRREKYAVSAHYTASAELIRTVYEGAGLGAVALGGDAGRWSATIDKLLEEAYQRRVSDIHIFRKQSGTEVFFRVDGTMTRVRVESPEWGQSIGVALFMRGDSDTKQTAFNAKAPQAMTISRRIRIAGLADPIDLRLRWQSSPMYPSTADFDAFIGVMRVIVVGGGRSSALTLDELGFLPPQRRGALSQLEHATGLTMLIGATGSGKSTTLQSMVEYLDKAFPGQNILAVEDPPEYPLAARQIPVVIQDGPADTESTRITTSYLRALRAAMRMDPDSILIGEIRDPASAQLAMNAALTGHRVLTTFHAASLVHCLQRLKTNGVGLEVLGSEGFLRSIISQSLIPLLCPSCSQQLSSQVHVNPSQAAHFAQVRERLGRYVTDLSLVRIQGPGCKECGGKGVKGRSALIEMLIPDVRMQGLISEGNWLALGHYWSVARLLNPETAEVAAGLTKLEHGLHLVRQGKVCPLMLDRLGVGRIGEEIPPALRLKELVRLGLIDKAEEQDALARFERDRLYPGLQRAGMRGGM